MIALYAPLPLIKRSTMPTVTRGFKYHIKPLPSQLFNLTQTFAACKIVYNELLARISANRAHNAINPNIARISPNNTNLSRMLTTLKQEPKYAWLQTVSSVALQETAFDLADAFTRFFAKKAKHPRFKNRYSNKSFRLTFERGFRLKGYDNRLLEIALETNPIHVVWSRSLPSTPSYATISRKPSGKFFVSFTCTYEQDTKPKPSTSDDVGADVGLTTYVTIVGKHTKVKVPNLRCLRRSERNLASKQRILARKRPGSKSHQKAKLSVARVHERIANQRDDIIHKLTTHAVATSDNICVESINTRGMLANHCLAKSVSDAAFNKFFTQLVYKATGSGNTRIMAAHRFYPSTQICSECDTRSEEKIKLGVSAWTCSACGAEHDRDYNAATNLRNLIDKNMSKFEAMENKGYGALLLVD